MSRCLACRRQNHLACLGDFCDCMHEEISNKHSDEFRPEFDRNPELAKNVKNDYALKDPQSTGRKRAAKLFPLDKERDCEFLGKTHAGAIPGLRGIDGCSIRPNSTPGKQQARHHLDYDTLNNDPDNVVRICHSCHRVIHEANDSHKDQYYAQKYGEAAARGLKRTYKKLREENVGD